MGRFGAVELSAVGRWRWRVRTIDADALKELFSEVIGHIAKKPEMNGNLEHMIRASAMVIQMIDDAPTVQPDTTTHDSIPAETGKNDGDRTSGDCISRQAALETIRTMQTYKLFAGDDMLLIDQAEAQTELMMLPSAKPVHKTGRWIEMSSTNHTYKCSVCGRLLVNITDGKNNVAKNYPYCHCGADMRPTERNSNV